MKHFKDFSLAKYNTFGISAVCKEFYLLDDKAGMEPLPDGGENLIILGGGSNVLFRNPVVQRVIHVGLKGFEVVDELKGEVYVRAAAGENWHQFVLYCIANDYGGIENLSLIPGNVGAAPIQNIGAYGVELHSVFHSLEAIELESGKIHVFHAQDCGFGYRDSVFKKELKGKYLIIDVTFKLTKENHHFQTGYGEVKAMTDKMENGELSLKKISQAIIAIRRSKLPDPDVLGNSGSFFKNALVGESKYEELKSTYPSIPAFELPGHQYKIPSAWLIEQCGWKGKRRGDAGVFDRHALVLVNYGQATGEEIYRLAKDIQSSVKAEFGIELTPEVNIVE